MWVGGGYVPTGTNVGTATTETYQVGTAYGGIVDRFLRRRVGERAAALAGARRSAVVVAAGALARRRLA